jgi:hypothetical protein
MFTGVLSDGEMQETLHWLDSAVACDYLADAEHGTLADMAQIVGKRLGSMINQHKNFCAP